MRNLSIGADWTQEIENLEHLQGLEELWLAKNKILSIQVRLQRLRDRRIIVC